MDNGKKVRTNTILYSYSNNISSSLAVSNSVTSVVSCNLLYLSPLLLGRRLPPLCTQLFRHFLHWMMNIIITATKIPTFIAINPFNQTEDIDNTMTCSSFSTLMFSPPDPNNDRSISCSFETIPSPNRHKAHWTGCECHNELYLGLHIMWIKASARSSWKTCCNVSLFGYILEKKCNVFRGSFYFKTTTLWRNNGCEFKKNIIIYTISVMSAFSLRSPYKYRCWKYIMYIFNIQARNFSRHDFLRIIWFFQSISMFFQIIL